MCLAIPMRVVATEGSRGRVASGGIETEISLDLTPEAAVGDYVIVHAGFAIQRLDREEAEETLEIFSRLEQSWNAPD
jgi:hydrogenase expression/formation protein HypC